MREIWKNKTINFECPEKLCLEDSFLNFIIFFENLYVSLLMAIIRCSHSQLQSLLKHSVGMKYFSTFYTSSWMELFNTPFILGAYFSLKVCKEIDKTCLLQTFL